MADGAVRLPPDSVGTSLRTVTNAGVANGAHQEVVTLAASDGTLQDRQEVRLDYGARTDGNPERVGKAPPGTAVSSPTWTIQTFTYDASARLTRVTVTTGAWS